jgi:hypothetical protein
MQFILFPGETSRKQGDHLLGAAATEMRNQ